MKSTHSKMVISFILLCAFSFIGWNHTTYQGIADFYYYKDAPFYLTKKTDGLFIKLKAPVSESKFRQITGSFPVVQSPAGFNASETKHFVRLNTPLNDAGILNLVSEINKIEEIEYCSPVFSPDNGTTLIGVENEIIVQFKPNLSQNEIQSFIESNNFNIAQKLSLTGGASYVLKVSKDNNSIEAANKVYRSGAVKWSEPNLYFTNLFCYTPNDTFYNMQWSLRNAGNNIPGGITGTIDCDMDVDSAWDVHLSTNKVIIAISDTGIDTLHEDLALNMVPGSGYNFYSGTPGGYDDGSHGTACAGIVAARGNNSIGVSGVAPNGRLIAVKWLSSGGSGNYTGATNATIYAYQQGAWVISNSWGFVGGASSALDAAINDASNLGRGGKGSVFVVASGNENGTMRYPAISHPRVVVIGGVSPCNQRKSPSSCDLESWWGASYGTNLDLVAPCTKIYTTDRTGSVGYSSGNYIATFNGTSSATPNAAGVIALMLSYDSTLTFDTVRARVDYTAVKVGSYTYDQPGPRTLGLWNNEMGYGLINAYRLLTFSTAPAGPTITHTPLPNTENVAGPYPVNAVITPAGSPINPALTKIYWSRNNPLITDSVPMTNSSGNNWTANIPGNGNPATYRYYIKAVDNLNRIVRHPVNAPTSLHLFLALSDTAKPVIVHTPLTDIDEPLWPATVNAIVTDNSGIDSVWVRWYKNTTSTGLKTFKLTRGSGSNYSAAFNSDTSQVAIGDSIFYRIITQDSSLAHNKDSTSLYKFKITGSQSACAGTGNVNVSYPFHTQYSDNRTQMLFLASEIPTPWPLNTAIHKISFTVVTPSPAVMNGFRIMLKNTTATTLTFFDTAAVWTTVYNGTMSISDSGTKEIEFQIPYLYTGFTNLLMQICFDNTAGTVSPVIKATSNAGKTWEQHSNTFFGCQILGGFGQVNRPNVCFFLTPWEGVPFVSNIPTEYNIAQNYPNPFNPSTVIKYAVPKTSAVKIAVYDLTGREIALLVNDVKNPGNYEVNFDASNLASGVYVYRIEAGDYINVKKMVLLK